MTARGQVVRFLVAGIAAIGTDFTIYYLLRLWLPTHLSKGTSFLCGSVVAYLLNKHWVFQQPRASRSGMARFVLASAAMLGINVLTNATVLQAWPRATLPALAAATSAASVTSFIVLKWWVFRT